MVGPRMCAEHGKEAVTHCGWCSRPICEACIEEAHGHRLCGSCAAKLAKDRPLEAKRRRSGRNVDETLTDEQLAKAKEHLAAKREQEGRRPRIRNVPDWPLLKEDR
ncbi:hypothetical protein JXA12_01555 [Candidatus Woesearchaeota archaeon]|nr:hypothetical protein [Candidatus Woesearchaeota archaeon]